MGSLSVDFTRSEKWVSDAAVGESSKLAVDCPWGDCLVGVTP